MFSDTLPILPADAVAIWLLDVNRTQHNTDILAVCQGVLSPQEREKYQRFRTIALQNRHALVRGYLRFVLATQLNLSPGEIPLVTNAYGRPCLAKSLNSSLSFNMSYSAHLALIVLAQDSLLGVDIEQIRHLSKKKIDDMIARWFSPQEYDEWQRLPPNQQLQGFYNGWTRKEAIIKALGLGLSFPLHQFSVTLTPNESVCLLEIMGQPQHDWQLHDISPHPGFAAALAWQGPSRRMYYYYGTDLPFYCF